VTDRHTMIAYTAPAVYVVKHVQDSVLPAQADKPAGQAEPVIQRTVPEPS